MRVCCLLFRVRVCCLLFRVRVCCLLFRVRVCLCVWLECVLVVSVCLRVLLVVSSACWCLECGVVV